MKPSTQLNSTQPPTRRERMTVEQFETIIREQGEAQARLQNLQVQVRR